jgi:hypothetical protein
VKNPDYEKFNCGYCGLGSVCDDCGSDRQLPRKLYVLDNRFAKDVRAFESREEAETASARGYNGRVVEFVEVVNGKRS